MSAAASRCGLDLDIERMQTAVAVLVFNPSIGELHVPVLVRQLAIDRPVGSRQGDRFRAAVAVGAPRDCALAETPGTLALQLGVEDDAADDRPRLRGGVRPPARRRGRPARPASARAVAASRDGTSAATRGRRVCRAGRARVDSLHVPPGSIWTRRAVSSTSRPFEVRTTSARSGPRTGMVSTRPSRFRCLRSPSRGLSAWPCPSPWVAGGDDAEGADSGERAPLGTAQGSHDGPAPARAGAQARAEVEITS